MKPATITFSKLVDKLQEHYGAPTPPPSTEPLELIIWENIAYLASDKRRAEAFAILKRTIGTRPEQILAAQHSALAAIGKAGILPDVSAEQLLTISKIAYEEFDSDLRSVLTKPLPQAKKALKRFPSIGDPGAEKILLFTRSYPVMALDSNGLRVLCRVGFGEEQKNYSATYRSVQEALRQQLPRDYDSLIRAHQLLRQHGQGLCKRSKPRCAECPLSDSCKYGRKV
jgi:endonuclease III